MNNSLPTILLIPSESDDYEDYYSIRCGQSDIYWMGYESKPDKEYLRTIFNSRLGLSDLQQEGVRRIYMVKDNARSVGFVMLSNLGQEIEIGISIVDEQRGNGYGAKAIELALFEIDKLGKNAIAHIRDDNIASQKCFIKNGFRRTDEFEVRSYPFVGNVKFRKYVHTCVVR